jgi:hypothetical protein
MMEQFPGLVIAYIGPNAAHRSLRAALANAKALAFVLVEKDSAVLRSFLAQAEEARRQSRDGNFALGMAGGRSTTTTVQLAIHLTGTEIALIDSEPGGFVAQALGLVYREVHRVFESYLISLFEEIALREKRVLFSNQKISHEEALRAADAAELQRVILEQRKADLSRAGFNGLERTFTAIGLPIVLISESPQRPEQENVRRRLILLSAIRNVIEHNRSIINREFLTLVPNSPYAVGERIAISVTELGDALSAVEWAADDLNQRAVAKFGLGEAPCH